MNFEWDETKNQLNKDKHGVSFEYAQYAFADPQRVILEDIKHSQDEKRYFCIGKVENGILTVRFTYRKNKIRIFGSIYWRKGRNIYETENNIQRRTKRC
ncbi:BrnT family toxin [Candidatus Magnetomoraceae bacterium gMMP-13]